MGPWEWDLKRLAVSLVLAGRGNGASDEESRVAVLTAVRAYRKVAETFRDTSVLDLWRLAVDDHSPLLHRYGRDDAVFRRGFASARRHDNVAALPKLTEIVDGHRRFRAEPPLLSGLEPDVRRDIVAGLAAYRRSALTTTAHRLADHDVVDVAQKVVGVGSVGTQDFVVLLARPDGSDPLFLQLKEAVPSDVRRVCDHPAPAARGRADRGRSAPDAGRQRPLPRLDDRAGCALLRAAAQGPQGLDAGRQAERPDPGRLRLAVRGDPVAGPRPDLRSRARGRLLRPGHLAGRVHRPLRRSPTPTRSRRTTRPS